MSTSVDFIVVLMDIIACLISLDIQVNLKTIEETAASWFAEAEHQEKFSGATCKSAQASMKLPQFQRLLSFMTTGADPEGSWKRSINYQEWNLSAAIKKLVKHQFMAANPGNLVVSVDFDIGNGYSVQGRAFPGVKPVEPMTVEDIRSVLESCSAAFNRAYPELISHTISVSGFVEAEEAQAAPAAEVQALIAELKAAKEEAQALIAELKAAKEETQALKATQATPTPKTALTPLVEDVRKMVEGPIPLSHEEALAKTAAVTHVKETLSWLSAIKKHFPVSQTAPAAASPATKVASATEWTVVGANGKPAMVTASGGARAGAGGGR